MPEEIPAVIAAVVTGAAKAGPVASLAITADKQMHPSKRRSMEWSFYDLLKINDADRLVPLTEYKPVRQNRTGRCQSSACAHAGPASLYSSHSASMTRAATATRICQCQQQPACGGIGQTGPCPGSTVLTSYRSTINLFCWSGVLLRPQHAKRSGRLRIVRSKDRAPSRTRFDRRHRRRDKPDTVSGASGTSLPHGTFKQPYAGFLEFIPIKSSTAKGSGEPESYATHNRLP